MARKIKDIQQSIINSMNADPVLVNPSNPLDPTKINNTSQTARWLSWTFIIAVAISIFEQTLDILQSLFETTVKQETIGIADWIQTQIYKFQYSATIPQIIDIIDLIPTYSIIDTTLQIITRCSVTPLGNKTVQVKVAQQEPPTVLDSSMLSALISYVDIIFPPGINYTVISADADKIRIDANIYYNGLYQAVIQTNVIAAINTFLSNKGNKVNFNDTTFLLELTAAVKVVEGINDVEFLFVSCRVDADSFIPAGNNVIYDLTNGINIRKYIPYAGYMVGEDTSGHTLSKTLTFIAGS